MSFAVKLALLMASIGVCDCVLTVLIRGIRICRVGYEFTRNTFEETENMPPNQLMDLYRHPDSHNPSTGSGTTFRKIFDLYAFGCVLLELVLWQNLEDILFAADRVMKKLLRTRRTSTRTKKLMLDGRLFLKAKTA